MKLSCEPDFAVYKQAHRKLPFMAEGHGEVGRSHRAALGIERQGAGCRRCDRLLRTEIDYIEIRVMHALTAATDDHEHKYSREVQSRNAHVHIRADPDESEERELSQEFLAYALTYHAVLERGRVHLALSHADRRFDRERNHLRCGR